MKDLFYNKETAKILIFCNLFYEKRVKVGARLRPSMSTTVAFFGRNPPGFLIADRLQFI